MVTIQTSHMASSESSRWSRGLPKAVVFAWAGFLLLFGALLTVYSLVTLLPHPEDAWFGLYVLAAGVLCLSMVRITLAMTVPGGRAERGRAHVAATNSWDAQLGVALCVALWGAGAGAAINGLQGATVGAAIGLLLMSPFIAFAFFKGALAERLERRVPFESVSPRAIRRLVAVGYVYVALTTAFTVGAVLVFFTHL